MDCVCKESVWETQRFQTTSHSRPVFKKCTESDAVSLTRFSVGSASLTNLQET
uniref:Uncharacterized protein n=1 Tax=Brassica oleracea TaxID=3712 RepID=A0A3P6HFF7_BRAOL|nr:unnamed protein product [Brassica oleracea]